MMAPLPATLILLLIAASAVPIRVGALSSHSPIDLYAFPRYQVSLGQEGVLNDTVADLLAESQIESTEHKPSNAHVQRRHLLRTPAGQAFLCTIPALESGYEPQAAARRHEMDAQSRALERERGLERGLELLEPMRGGCLFLRQSWFTYSFCYGDKIRQFHAEHTPGSAVPAEDPKADAYTLGYSPEPVSTIPPKYGSGSSELDRKHQKLPATLGGGGVGAEGVTELGGLGGWDAAQGGRYLTQTWDDGTICDKTNLPRSVEVQFHCNTGTMDRIALITETAICRYVMIIYTPRLCSEPVFLEGHDASMEPSHQIECQPVVSKLRNTVDATEGQQQQQPTKEAHVETQNILKDSSTEQGDHTSTVGLDTELDPAAVREEAGLGISGEGPLLDLDVTLAVDHGGRSDDESDDDDGEVIDVLTVVYDVETGQVHASGSDATEGELEAALQGRPLEDVEGNQVRERGNEADAGPTMQSLEALTKLMRESIAEALRQYSADSASDGDRSGDRNAGPQEGGPPDRRGASAPRNGQEGHQNTPESDGVSGGQNGDNSRQQQQAGTAPALSLKEILDNLAAGTAGGVVGQARRTVLKRDVLGEAEHRALMAQFQQLYDHHDDDDHSEDHDNEGGEEVFEEDVYDEEKVAPLRLKDEL